MLETLDSGVFGYHMDESLDIAAECSELTSTECHLAAAFPLADSD